MKKTEIKVNDVLVTDVPFDENEWEVKIYLYKGSDGELKIRSTTLRSLMDNEKGIITGYKIG